MNYEQKYKEALERAKEELRVCGSQDCDAARQIFRFFPELKESEDERIRKTLIAFFRDWERTKSHCWNVNVSDIIAWLEKQGQVKESLISQHEIEMCKENDDSLTREDDRIKREILDYINELANLKNEKIPTEWLDWLEKQDEPKDKGEISDGYHTFNELYRYRMLYNAAFFNLLPKELVHKSKRHHDGKECFGGGWFIVMANLPTGQISNHYELKDWDLFQIPEKEIADEWDGHTPKEAAERLHKYLLEKQGKQTADKVESKFKVGDCEKKELKKIEHKMLDADEVIDWLKTKVYDDSTYGMAIIKQFKQDFGL